MKIVAIDIETIPDQGIPEGCMPVFDPSDVKFGNIKDQAKIEAKIEAARKSFKDKISKTMSIDPSYAQLCTFCAIQYDTKQGKIIEEKILQVEKDADDYEAVFDGWEYITRSYLNRLPIVTFNGKSFDLPVLFMRSIAKDVSVEAKIYGYLVHRYQNNYHYDLLQLLCGWDKQKWHGLDFFLKKFGIGSNGDMDGSMVWSAYQNGEYDKIKQYCRSDVLNTCQLFARVEPWVISKEDE